MQEVLKDNHILTINDVAAILRCSKTHVSHVLAGKIPGIPRLTHIAMGRRKLTRRLSRPRHRSLDTTSRSVRGSP